MQKNKLNYLIDFLAFIAFLITAVTGLIIFFFLPDGIRQGGLQEFMGITKRVYIDIHDYAGIILTILVLIHIILHWRWIIFTTKNFFKKGVSNPK